MFVPVLLAPKELVGASTKDGNDVAKELGASAEASDDGPPPKFESTTEGMLEGFKFPNRFDVDVFPKGQVGAGVVLVTPKELATGAAPNDDIEAPKAGNAELLRKVSGAFRLRGIEAPNDTVFDCTNEAAGTSVDELEFVPKGLVAELSNDILEDTDTELEENEENSFPTGDVADPNGDELLKDDAEAAKDFPNDEPNDEFSARLNETGAASPKVDGPVPNGATIEPNEKEPSLNGFDPLPSFNEKLFSPVV